MIKGMRGTQICGLVAAVAFPLLLSGCFAPHVVNVIPQTIVIH